MSEGAAINSPAQAVNAPKVMGLGRDVVLLVWDVPQASRYTAPKIAADDNLVSPLASVRLTRLDGGSRVVWALRRPDCSCVDLDLSTGAAGLRAAVTLDPQKGLTAVKAEDLVDGIKPSSQAVLVSALLNVWSVMFKLHRSRSFNRVLREVVLRVAEHPERATAVAVTSAKVVLLRTSIPASLGKVDAVYALGEAGPLRIDAQPHGVGYGDKTRQALHLLADREVLDGPGTLLVLVGPAGVSVRLVDPVDPALPGLDRWFREHASTAPALREHLLGELAAHSEAGRAMALEAQLRSPLKPQRASHALATASAEIVCALATPAGTLVTGWYRDPLGLVAGIDMLGSGTSGHDLMTSMHRFPVKVKGKGGDLLPATGFAVLAPASGPAPLLQPRFRLRLKSGAFHMLVPPVQPSDPVEARAAALRAVPAQHVDDALLVRVLQPVIAALHQQAKARVGTPAIIRIGTPLAEPKASIIVPLYKALDFLRFQIAAFATDPWITDNAELIYVLDSPEQAHEVEHLLGGLHLTYELPVTLVVMERNGGYAAANNVGASFARGEVLALVNSDVIPTRSGWLEALAARLDDGRQVGAVGSKLLFEDGSIQHAGMFFSRDHLGRWLNQHFHKGMPRAYAPACEERLVPAVTGACLVTSRAVFETVGGFTDDYVVGDYEDSDLCLKITASGRRIAYCASVELYHLERKSMSLNAEYMRGIAWQYNCALHGERWGSLMNTLMQAERPRNKRSAA